MAQTDARNAVIEQYFNMVYKLALSQTKNVHNAEDVVQNVFLKYLQNSHKLMSSEHEKAWLIRVTLNECKSFFASSWFKKTVPLDESLNLSFDTPEKSDVYYSTLKLPPKYRAVIHLFYYEDMSIAQIAKTLGQKESTVKTHLHRGRELLKKTLKGGYDDV